MSTLGKFAALSVAAVLILASCGGSDGGDESAGSTTESSASTTTSEAESTTTAGPDAPATAVDAIQIIDFAFDPDPVEIKVGTTVTWTNEDPDAHTATSDDDAPVAFDTGELAQGAAGEVSFDMAGTYAYVCTIHNYMSGTLTVVE